MTDNRTRQRPEIIALIRAVAEDCNAVMDCGELADRILDTLSLEAGATDLQSDINALCADNAALRIVMASCEKWRKLRPGAMESSIVALDYAYACDDLAYAIDAYSEARARLKDA